MMGMYRFGVGGVAEREAKYAKPMADAIESVSDLVR